MFRFHKTYFLLFLLLFCIEVLIALFVHDSFVRPYLGDVLVVMLLYCFVCSFLNLRRNVSLFLVLAFAFVVETAQYFSVVSLLGLQDDAVARTVIGNSFDWQDLMAYAAGGVVIFVVERWRLAKAVSTNWRSS